MVSTNQMLKVSSKVMKSAMPLHLHGREIVPGRLRAILSLLIARRADASFQLSSCTHNCTTLHFSEKSMIPHFTSVVSTAEFPRNKSHLAIKAQQDAKVARLRRCRDFRLLREEGMILHSRRSAIHTRWYHLHTMHRRIGAAEAVRALVSANVQGTTVG